MGLGRSNGGHRGQESVGRTTVWMLCGHCECLLIHGVRVNTELIVNTENNLCIDLGKNWVADLLGVSQEKIMWKKRKM